ncbi:MAG: hypothetical protein AB1805_13210 [Nitrospirota bacterium]
MADNGSKVEEIIDGLTCPKALSCYNSKFNNLCKALDIGLESFLICLEEKKNGPRSCKFSVPFGDTFFCQCPLRVYIAKSLKK